MDYSPKLDLMTEPTFLPPKTTLDKNELLIH